MTSDRYVFVYNQTKGTFVASRVKVGDNSLSRVVGLRGKRSLGADGGLWIVPAQAVHTFGMMFRLDLVLLDADFRVVGMRERIAPFQMTRPNLRAGSVIELPVHTILRSGTEVGDQFVIERFEARRAENAGRVPAAARFAASFAGEVATANRLSRTG